VLAAPDITPLLAHVGGGVFVPLQVTGITIITVAYLLRSVSLAQRGRPVGAWHQIAFYSGIGVIAFAFVSPIAHIGEELIFVHMIQHLLIGDIAALLIVLGLTRAILAPLMAIKIFDKLKILIHPAVALPLWIVNMFFWHLPFVYDATVTNDTVHALQHIGFINAGIIFWMPVAGPLPIPRWFGGGAQLTYVAISRLASAGLGNILMWSGTVLYPAYLPGEEYWGIDPLADQGIAGAIMMGEGTLITLGLLFWLLVRWSERENRKQALLELVDRLGAPVTEERIDRAVAAGQGKRLQQWILDRYDNPT